MKFKQIAAALFAAMAMPVFAAPIYFNNFESNAAGFTGAGALAATQGYGAQGYGKKFLRNDTGGDPAGASELTLNLASFAGGAVLSLDLAIIDSWDGNLLNGHSNEWGPDFFNVVLDGNLIFSQNFDAFGSASIAPNLTNKAYGIQLGFSDFKDAAYSLNLALGDLSAGEHVLQFFAHGEQWQAGADESWGIDNVSVTDDRSDPTAVPEPLSGALVLAGLGAMGLVRRRRNQA